MASCVLVNSYERFGETFWLHILGLISARRVEYSGHEYGGTKLLYTSVATSWYCHTPKEVNVTYCGGITFVWISELVDLK